jgi:hypothetical protein
MTKYTLILAGIIVGALIIFFIVYQKRKSDLELATYNLAGEKLAANTAALQGKTTFKDVVGPIASIFGSVAKVWGGSGSAPATT